MTTEQYIIFATLAMVLILFIWGRLRYDIVALPIIYSPGSGRKTGIF